MQDPETPEQWQAAVDMIVALLYMDASQSYGLAKVNLQRCGEILKRAKALGYIPSDRNVARLTASANGARALLDEADQAALAYHKIRQRQMLGI